MFLDVKREKQDLFGDEQGHQETGDDPLEPVNVPKQKRDNANKLAKAKKIVDKLNVVPDNKDSDLVMSESGQGKPSIVYKGHRYVNADKERGETTLSWCSYRQ